MSSCDICSNFPTYLILNIYNGFAKTVAYSIVIYKPVAQMVVVRI